MFIAFIALVLWDAAIYFRENYDIIPSILTCAIRGTNP